MSTVRDVVDTAAEPDHAVLPYDPVGSRIGMWLFLFTELMLFGALFIAFAVYLTPWSVFVGTSLASACGVAL